MILVLAGTQDGRELAARLANSGYPLILSVVSEYGKQIACQERMRVIAGGLDRRAMERLIRDEAVKLIIDASHPYAAAVSQNAMQAAAQTKILYLRYERPEVALPDYEKLWLADNPAEAARKAASLGRIIFLTTGSRTLAVYKQEAALQECRLIARVLPDSEVIAECVRLGFAPRDIVAMQGPFSVELNKELFRSFGTEVVISKNSGEIGGTDTKLAAAIELGIHLVMIGRPPVSYTRKVDSQAAVLRYLEEVYS